MYERIQCLCESRIDKLSKYLKGLGYFCLPRFGYPNPFLYILIENKKKKQLWIRIEEFKQEVDKQ